jgi:hypothetical protein
MEKFKPGLEGLTERHAYIEAIGMVTARWAAIEALVDFHVFNLSSREGLEINIKNMRQGFKQRCKALRDIQALFWTNESDNKQLKVILDKILETKLERDAMVHGEWRENDGDVVCTSVDWDGPTINVRHLNVRDVKNIAEQINDLFHDLISRLHLQVVPTKELNRVAMNTLLRTRPPQFSVNHIRRNQSKQK